MAAAPPSVLDALFVASDNSVLGDTATPVRGYDLNNGLDWEKLFGSYATMGFQGTALGDAVQEVKKMVIECILLNETD